MRIISGSKRQMQYFAPKSDKTRPTSDRIKENAFNLIGPVYGNILDLFAGSGGIGLEFLSRGADFVAFVDNSKDAIRAIEKNLKKASFKNYIILNEDYKDAIRYLKDKNIKFDFVYLDPPWADDLLYSRALENLLKYDLLKDQSLVICESQKTRPEFDLELLKDRKYGEKIISIWKV